MIYNIIILACVNVNRSYTYILEDRERNFFSFFFCEYQVLKANWGIKSEKSKKKRKLSCTFAITFSFLVRFS